jgi:hypothetical protein
MNAHPGSSSPISPLDYEGLRNFAGRRAAGFAWVMFAIAIATGGLAVKCAMHVFQYEREMNKPTGPVCGNYLTERMAALAPPPEVAIPIGLFLAGISIASAIQGIRFFNSGSEASSLSMYSGRGLG